MVKSFYLIIFFVLLSCKSGHIDKFGVYVPDNQSHYKLKNKQSDKIPKELDTINLYRYYGYYNQNNELVCDTLDNNNWKIYTKYCSNGRVYSFGTDNLNEKNMNSDYGSKGYYVYCKGKNEITYETFTNGNGGQFVLLKYKLSKSGDTITNSSKERYSDVYIRHIIPREWKVYKPNW